MFQHFGITTATTSPDLTIYSLTSPVLLDQSAEKLLTDAKSINALHLYQIPRKLGLQQ
jgi:hypothetical protein